MNTEELREYCLNLKVTTESFPFDDFSLAFNAQWLITKKLRSELMEL